VGGKPFEVGIHQFVFQETSFNIQTHVLALQIGVLLLDSGDGCGGGRSLCFDGCSPRRSLFLASGVKSPK
jgi:hypothetical protein